MCACNIKPIQNLNLTFSYSYFISHNGYNFRVCILQRQSTYFLKSSQTPENTLLK